MALDLARLVDPGHTVLVTQECQRGIIGDVSPLRELADAAASMRAAAGRLADTARRSGVPVVHCVALRRPDGLAASTNARMYAVALKAGMALHPGSDAAALVPELGPEEGDLTLGRYHGLGPMWGTDLDAVCRNLGATTIVGIGASVNVGMLSLGLDAVNAGYQFVLPRDAVVGVPQEYADAVVANTFAVIGTVVTVDDLIDAWGAR